MKKSILSLFIVFGLFIISSFANEKQKSELLIIANNLKVELIEMVWKHDSFETRDYKKSIEFINKINI